MKKAIFFLYSSFVLLVLSVILIGYYIYDGYNNVILALVVLFILFALMAIFYLYRYIR